MDVLKIAVALMNLYLTPTQGPYSHCVYAENWDYPISHVLGVPAIRINCESETNWSETDLVPVVTPNGIFALPLSANGFKS